MTFDLAADTEQKQDENHARWYAKKPQKNQTHGPLLCFTLSRPS
jgi:hypothetical protein